MSAPATDVDATVITGVGLVTAVGRDRVSAPAALRAGIGRFQELPGFAGRKGERAIGSVVYGLTDDRGGADRLLSLAIPALKEALAVAAEYSGDLDLLRTLLLVSVAPDERPGYDRFDSDDAEVLLARSGLSALRPSVQDLRAGRAEPLTRAQREAVDRGATQLPPSIEILRDGHAGGALALERAEALIRSGRARHVIVGGVDSLVDSPTLHWLDEAGRLRTDERPDGFAPGEAAAFLVLERRSSAEQRGSRPLAELTGVASSREEASILSDRPLRGLGLSRAIEEAVRGAGAPADAILCDINGEYYRSKEWALAAGRVFAEAEGIPELWHPAEGIGDVGAASAVVLAAVAVGGLERGYFPGTSVLTWTSSDHGTRGCALLRAASPAAAEPEKSAPGRAPVLPDVLEEYLEEAVWLVGARNRCLVDPELSWEDLADLDQRLDAHLHGLVLGGLESARLLEPALLLDAADDHEASFVAGAVYPALGWVEPMQWLVEAIASDPPNLPALLSGLRYPERKPLAPYLREWSKDASPALRSVAMELLGDGGGPDLDAHVVPRIDDPEPRVALAALAALERSGRPVPADRIGTFLGAEDPRLAARAATLLLRLGDRGLASRLRDRLSSAESELRRELVGLLAVAGGPSDCQLIMRELEERPENAEANLLALGLCGSPSAAEPLIACLSRTEPEGEFTAAYQALRILSGIDALPEFELEEVPVEQLAAYQEVWRRWLRDASGLSPELKWRRGRPLSPEILARELLRTGNPCRDLTYLELRARYRCPIEFHPGARYATQARELPLVYDWASREAERVHPGVPYMNGEPLS